MKAPQSHQLQLQRTHNEKFERQQVLLPFYHFVFTRIVQALAHGFFFLLELFSSLFFLHLIYTFEVWFLFCFSIIN